RQSAHQYALVLLPTPPGCFLDDPTDMAATDARRRALLDFVRGGKGLAGIHAASDSYQGPACSAPERGAGARGRAGASPQPPGGLPLWPKFNKMIGGYFKFHWVDPQLITVKIDDPRSPLTKMFHGQEFEIRDET